MPALQQPSLQTLCNLAGQPLLIHGPHAAAHAARLAGGLRQLLAHGRLDPLPAESAASANPDDRPPWEKREDISLLPGGIAIVPIVGTLASGLDQITAWWLDCCRVEAVHAALQTLAARADVRAVVLAVHSPGGYIGGIPEGAALVERLAEEKLVLCWSTFNCSAAYWLTAHASRHIAAPSATIGNVGVQVVYHDTSRMFQEAGIDVRVFKSGAYKGAGIPGTSLTDEQAEFIQARVDRLAAQFIGTVQAARPLIAAADCQGQWWDGEQAVERHFADATALTLEELVATLRSPQVAALTA